MFSRRHPFLFFFLASFSVLCGTVVLLALIRGWKAGDFRPGKKVGIVEITGAIEDSWFPVEALRAFADNDRIAAIVLRVDSPGGGVAPSQEIYREVERTVEVKPVVVSMGSMATSGGYYAGACSDGIMASPGTITGSIGALIEYYNYKGLLDKIGLYSVVIKSAQFKDMASPTRELTPEEQALLRKNLESIHQQFIEDVAKGRNLAPEAVRALADGRIFTGKEALELGLVDSLGNLADAIDWAGELGGLTGEIRYEYAEPEERDFLGYILDYTASRLSGVAGTLPRFSYKLH